MSAPRYLDAKRLFLAVRGLEAEAREAALAREADAELVADVRGLLAVDSADADELEPAPPRPALPESIAGYRIEGLLGEGGMGLVYRARQESPHRTVALKVLRPGWVDPSAMQRFVREAEILGSLQHPGIAHVYEAGAAEEGGTVRPFFAMEHVDGEPITDWARRHAPGVRARVELLAAVCDAVEHAHRRDVVHRDLKPANVLVDAAGHPKVLDFGIARSTDADRRATTLRTGIGQLLGTVAYMSPEQARADADLDGRSDVYALGVLGYELLADRLPYDLAGKPLTECLRTIGDQEPTPLGAVRPELRGDLETVLHHALEKERERRYPSALALADDLRRVLRDEPILARAPSAAYQLEKLARRHRGLVAGLCATLVALVAGTATSLAFAFRARDRAEEASIRTVAAQVAEAQAQDEARRADLAARKARDQAASAREVADFLVGLFESNDPAVARGEEVVARDLLDRGAWSIEHALGDQPVVRMRLSGAIGRAYSLLGLPARAEPLLQTALELARDSSEVDELDRAYYLSALAQVRAHERRWAEAEELALAARDLRAEHLPPGSPERIRGDLFLGTVYNATSRFDLARETLSRVIADAETHLPATDDARGLALLALGLTEAKLGDEDAAVASRERALAAFAAALPDDHPRFVSGHNSLAMSYARLGRPADAERHYGTALALARRILPPDHPNRLLASLNLAVLLADEGRLEEARPRALEVLEVEADLPEYPHRSVALGLLGRAALARGDVAEGVELLERSLAAAESALGAEHESLAPLLGHLALALRRADRDDDAVPLLERAAAIVRERRGPGVPDLAAYEHNLANLHLAAGRLEPAAEHYARALDVLDRLSRPPAWRATTLRNYAQALRGLGRDDEAAAVEARSEDHVGE